MQDGDVVQEIDDLREHYHFDYNKAKPNRFADQFSEETIAIVLDPDVAAVFTTPEAANQALRALIAALRSMTGLPGLLEKPETKTAQVDIA